MSASFGGDASSSSRVPLAAYAAADADADAAAHSFTETQMDEYREQDRYLPIANVSRIMKDCLPSSAKIAKESKECLQECVSEFISFITSEASERCLNEKRKTMNGEDILDAMTSLGFDNYVESLKPYLAKYRMSQSEKPRRSSKSGKSQNGGGTKGSAAGGVGAGGSKKVGSGGPGLGGEVDEDDEGEEGLYDDEEEEDEEDEEDEADAEDGSERWEKRARVG